MSLLLFEAHGTPDEATQAELHTYNWLPPVAPLGLEPERRMSPHDVADSLRQAQRSTVS